MKPLVATYRLQLHAGFTFADAQKQLAYLRQLGISHVYLSPIAEARPGSTHFYDGVDPTRISGELGGEQAFRRFAAACRTNGLSIIVDIVPNHMGIGCENPYWMEVLEFGPKTAAAAIFDIDWSKGRLTLPFLGAAAEKCLAQNELALALEEDGRIVLRYFDSSFPLRPGTVATLLAEAASEAKHEEGARLAEQWASLDHAPVAEKRQACRERLREALAESAEFREALERRVAEAGKPTSLVLLLESQYWHLTYWRDGEAELNYRRFFNISSLAGLRVEDAEVFDLVHRLPVSLVKQGLVDGLRIDHIDGLADPSGYCRRLRDTVGPDVTLHVEKILAPEERLPDWPVDGTTGYEMLNLVTGAFIDGAGYQRLRKHAAAALGITGDPRHRTYAAKEQLLRETFTAELDQLSALAADLAESRADAAALREALIAFIARCPVYRTYLTEEEPSGADLGLIETVLDVCTAGGAASGEALDVLRRLLTGAAAVEVGEFRIRLQQLTGPVMAKGFEDTELYRYVVLLSANEVGGSTEQPALDADSFHARARIRAQRPLTLVPLATHDTKRGGDARARLNVLSEAAEEWIEATTRWSKMNEALRHRMQGQIAPSPADEAFIYQTLLGCWPADLDRVKAAILKSMREAKLHTRWEEPREAYENGVMQFLEQLIAGERGKKFRSDFEGVVEPLIDAGRRNSINQTVLQMTIPGVPDIYQGTELWDFSLVDPDNRRPVDWQRGHELAKGKGAPLLDPSAAGKQLIIRKLLALRAETPQLFTTGTYVPIALASDVPALCFARVRGKDAVLVVVQTRSRAVVDAIALELPAGFHGPWRDVLSERGIELAARTELALPLPLVLKRQRAT